MRRERERTYLLASIILPLYTRAFTCLDSSAMLYIDAISVSHEKWHGSPQPRVARLLRQLLYLLIFTTLQRRLLMYILHFSHQLCYIRARVSRCAAVCSISGISPSSFLISSLFHISAAITSRRLIDHASRMKAATSAIEKEEFRRRRSRHGFLFLSRSSWHAARR